jgi:uncharacterized protein with WD repeat
LWLRHSFIAKGTGSSLVAYSGAKKKHKTQKHTQQQHKHKQQQQPQTNTTQLKQHKTQQTTTLTKTIARASQHLCQSLPVVFGVGDLCTTISLSLGVRLMCLRGMVV